MKISTLGFKASNLGPASLTNVNRSVVKNLRKTMSNNDSIVSSHSKRTWNRPNKAARNSMKGMNKSLQRYISSTQDRISKSKNNMAGNIDSRNTNIYKSKSISQNDKPLKFESKNQHSMYGPKDAKMGATMRSNNDVLNRTQQISLNNSGYKDTVLKRVPSQ